MQGCLLGLWTCPRGRSDGLGGQGTDGRPALPWNPPRARPALNKATSLCAQLWASPGSWALLQWGRLSFVPGRPRGPGSSRSSFGEGPGCVLLEFTCPVPVVCPHIRLFCPFAF